MTTIHTQHGLHIVDTEADDEPIVEPYSLGYIAGGALALVLWTALICGLAGYWVGS